MPLNGLPIIEHHSYEPSSEELTRIEQVVEYVQQEFQPAQKDAPFQHLVPKNLDAAPTVHIDDFSAVDGIKGRFEVRHLQDRARLRAADGDIVISTWPETPGYEDYCERVLGLGTVTWLRPIVPELSLHIALPCWQDRDCRRELVRSARLNGLRYVHPCMGTLATWELAELLHRASRQPIHVIAPPPELCRLVNDKVEL